MQLIGPSKFAQVYCDVDCRSAPQSNFFVAGYAVRTVYFLEILQAVRQKRKFALSVDDSDWCPKTVANDLMNTCSRFKRLVLQSESIVRPELQIASGRVFDSN